MGSSRINFYRLIAIGLLLFFILFTPHLYSQTKDSLVVTSDSVKTDSTKISKKGNKENDIDTIITYSAKDSIAFSLHSNQMEMYKKGEVTYKEITLNAHHISVQLDSSNVFATGDTAKETLDELNAADSGKTKKKLTKAEEKKQHQSLKAKLIDGNEVYYGDQLAYNFKSQKGRIILAETQIDAGFYYGEKIKRIKNDVIYVADGRYTTCNLDTPHYYFFAPKMKLVPRNRVVAEPIYLYIADAPVFALPFGIFPNKSGRRSGLIAPAYGEDARFGRYLSHLGYYWAIDDYMDMSATGDIFTRGSYAISSDYKYNLRYYFTGGLSGNYRHYYVNEITDPDHSEQEAYSFGIQHHQTINPTSQINVDFRFASNNSYVLTNNINDALRQSIESRATYTKSWEGTPNSFSANLSRSQNLRDGSTSEVLPSFSFNRYLTYPFRKKSSKSDFTWYELIGYSYGINASNSDSKNFQKVSGIKVGNSFQTVSAFQKSNGQNIGQSIGFNLVAPKLGYFTLTPSLSLSESRTYSKTTLPLRSYIDSTLSDTTQKNSRVNGRITDGVSLSTKLFGISQPNILGISAFRHTFSPAVSLTHSHQIYGERAGNDKASMRLGFSGGNNFEMKTMPNPTDTLDKGKKIQLLNLSFGGGYDFEADSMNFSEIGFNYHTQIGEFFNIGGGGSYNLYKYDKTANRRINQLLIKHGKIADLTNLGFSVSTSLTSDKIKNLLVSNDVKPGKKDSLSAEFEEGESDSLSEEKSPVLPWAFDVGWNFSQSNDGKRTSHSSSLSGSLSISLTQLWKLSVSGNYDVVTKQFAAPSINITRDLHCWTMAFSWVPTGLYRSWRFEIRILDSQLQDVKLTKSRSSNGVYD